MLNMELDGDERLRERCEGSKVQASCDVAKTSGLCAPSPQLRNDLPTGLQSEHTRNHAKPADASLKTSDLLRRHSTGLLRRGATTSTRSLILALFRANFVTDAPASQLLVMSLCSRTGTTPTGARRYARTPELGVSVKARALVPLVRLGLWHKEAQRATAPAFADGLEHQRLRSGWDSSYLPRGSLQPGRSCNARFAARAQNVRDSIQRSRAWQPGRLHHCHTT